MIPFGFPNRALWTFYWWAVEYPPPMWNGREQVGLLRWLDDLYHDHNWLPLRWACDAYDRKLLSGSGD